MLWWDVGSTVFCSVVHLTDTVGIQHVSPCIYLRFASKQLTFEFTADYGDSPWKIIDSTRPRQPPCLWALTERQEERWKSVLAAMNFTVRMRCKSLLPIFQMPLERTKSWIVIMQQDQWSAQRSSSSLHSATHWSHCHCVHSAHHTMSFHQRNKHWWSSDTER